MYTRLFYGTIQPGRGEEAWTVLHDLIPKVKGQQGCGHLQVLQSGDEIVGITGWIASGLIGPRGKIEIYVRRL